MSAREQMLASVRAALRDVPSDEPASPSASLRRDPAADYDRSLGLRPGEAVELFCERCTDYRASVSRVEDSVVAIRAAVHEICIEHAVRRLVAPASIDAHWLDLDVPAQLDDGSTSVAELERCDATLTGCALAIAQTGTIILDGGVGQGRRVLSLLPDLLICVVRASQIVDGVPGAFARLAGSSTSPITFISGPSATSDIELERVEGVHGPRRLQVIVAASGHGVQGPPVDEVIA